MIVRIISTFSQKYQISYLRHKHRIIEKTEPSRGSVSLFQVANSGYITMRTVCQAFFETGICQVKVGKFFQNHHNAQCQKLIFVRDFKAEILLSHFIEEGILCICLGS